MDTQRFIELGEGFGDVFELCELIRTNSRRICRAFILETDAAQGAVSLAVALFPAGGGHFMPVYICREGIKAGSTRQRMFTEALEEAGFVPVALKVRPSSDFGSPEEYYRHLTGVLRANRLLPAPELMLRAGRQMPPL